MTTHGISKGLMYMTYNTITAHLVDLNFRTLVVVMIYCHGLPSEPRYLTVSVRRDLGF